MEVIPFRREHLKGFEPQDRQAGVLNAPAQHLAELERSYSFSVFHRGKCIAVGGMVEQWAGRWLAWCALSKHAGKDMVALTRIAWRHLETLRAHRIEASVEADFEEGHRWLTFLGFTCEAPLMRDYVQGQNHALYSKVG